MAVWRSSPGPTTGGLQFDDAPNVDTPGSNEQSELAGVLDGFFERADVENRETGDELLGLGEGAIDDSDVAVTDLDARTS
jgi:hypothetical protein